MTPWLAGWLADQAGVVAGAQTTEHTLYISMPQTRYGGPIVIPSKERVWLI